MTMTGRPADRALVWLGVATWCATIGLSAACLWLRASSQAPPLPNRFGMTDAGLVGFGVLQITCASVALLIVARLPRNLVAWLLLGIGFSYAIAIAAAAWAFGAAVRPGSAGLQEAAWLNQFAGLVPGVLTGVLVLVYPQPLATALGRAVPIVAAIMFTFLAVVIPSIYPGRLWLWSSIDNPFGVGPRLLGDMDDSLVYMPAVLGIGWLVGCTWIAWRYHRSDRIQRLQLKWFGSASLVSLAALGLVGVIGATGRGSEAGWWSLLLYASTGALVPIAIGIAILRYHLYAIDRLVNRVMVYSAVTVLLAGVFGSLVVLVGGTLTAFTREYQTVAVAVSTLAVAGLFNPVRRRIQLAVDRRFDRERYDAELTVAGFSDRLRQTVDLHDVEDETLEVVMRTLRPTAAGVWLAMSR